MEGPLYALPNFGCSCIQPSFCQELRVLKRPSSKDFLEFVPICLWYVWDSLSITPRLLKRGRKRLNPELLLFLVGTPIPFERPRQQTNSQTLAPDWSLCICGPRKWDDRVMKSFNFFGQTSQIFSYISKMAKHLVHVKSGQIFKNIFNM